LRRAMLVRYPGIQTVRRLEIEDDPPWLALSWRQSESAEQHFGARLPLHPAEAVTFLLRLAEPLAEAHRLGLAHGNLTAAIDVTPAAEEMTTPPLAPGRVLGRVHLLELLGKGGMGTVYRAEDPADGRAVAIKVLRADAVSQPAAVQRFRKEARLLAEVRSPCVA